MKKLTDICDIQYGYAFDSKCFSEDSSYPQLVRIRDVKRGFSETYYSGEYPEDYVLHTGDLLVGMDGEFNIARWKIDGALLNQRVCKLTAKEGTNEEYLRFAMVKALKAIEDKTAFVTVKHLSAKELNKLELDIPSLAEQDSRADSLAKLEKIIDLRTEELRQLDEIIKARFVELFGDPNVEFKFDSHKFKEYASDMTKGPFGSDMKKDLYVPKGEDTYKVYIQINAIQGDQSLGDYYISKEYFDQKISRFEVHPGDIIITCDGTLGKHLKLNENMERGVISPSLLRLTLDESKMTQEYFEYMWDMYMLLLMKKEARNACLVHLPSAKVIGDVDIPVAPFELQQEFSTFVKQVDKSKFEIQKSLDETQQLFDSLMQCYFG